MVARHDEVYVAYIVVSLAWTLPLPVNWEAKCRGSYPSQGGICTCNRGK